MKNAIDTLALVTKNSVPTHIPDKELLVEISQLKSFNSL